MNHEEKLEFLVRELCNETKEYKDLKVNKNEMMQVFRSLMNIRMPKPASKGFLKIQDEFLLEESKRKGIVRLDDIKTIKEEFGSDNKFNNKISIWQGDITRLEVDAICNAANSEMLGCFVPMHSCIDNCIHSYAGIELRQECFEYMVNKRKEDQDYEEPTGNAVITLGYNLPCKYVIHTVGPIVYDRLTEDLRNDLKKCYESVLQAALDKGIRSIAFCCISTGVFHFPNEEACKIAVSIVSSFLDKHENDFDRIVFNVFKDLDLEIYKGELGI